MRADEVGTGQSPGAIDVLSKEGMTKPFCDLIEWSASQRWSNGKVGIMGISCAYQSSGVKLLEVASYVPVLSLGTTVSKLRVVEIAYKIILTTCNRLRN